MTKTSMRTGARLRAGLAALALLSTLTPTLSAQVNIEALRRDDPPPGRSGSFTGDLTVRTGNVDLVQVGLSGRHDVVTEGATTLIVGDGGIGLLGGSRFASSGLLHLRRTHDFGGWLLPEWYAQTNYDRAQLLRFRLVGGAGIRSEVARGDWGQLGAGTSLMVEHERLKLGEEAEHPSQTTSLRSSTFVSLKLSSASGFVVTSTTYLQPMLRRPGDVRILENMRLSSPVTERVALTVSFDLRYDARPPDGIAALDSTLRTGITYTY